MSVGETDPLAGAQGQKSTGLVASLKQLGLTLLAMAQTRLALAGVEIEETLQWLVGLLLKAMGLLVVAMLGLMSVTALAVLAADPDQRLLVLAVFVAFYLLAGGFFWWGVQRALASRPVLLQATLSAMVKDRQALQMALSTSEDAKARDA